MILVELYVVHVKLFVIHAVRRGSSWLVG